MPFFLDTQETSQRFGSHIAEFCSLLDTNHLSHGSPADFFPFAEAIENSNSFRLDLSSLVKSVAQQEHGELLLTDMMSIIAASVCGPSYADTSIDLTAPSNALMEFLLGTGLWKQFGSPPPRTTPAPPSIEHTEVSSPVRPSVPSTPPPTPPTGAGPSERATLLDASSELRQTLTRLEINTLQVKLHLEAIEQRINKIEPANEGDAASSAPSHQAPLPSNLENTPKAAPVSQTQPRVEPAQEDDLLPIDPPLFGSLSSSRSRAVFSHPDPEYDDDGFTAPTFGYSSERRISTPIIIFVILALILVAFLFFTRTGSGQRLLQSTKDHIDAIRASAHNNTAAPAPAPQSSSQPSSSASQTTTPRPATTTPPPTSQAKNEPAVAPSSTPESSADNSSDATAAQARNPNLRYVSANVMEGNLLAAPRPIYPPAARSAHLEGIVTLQATISRSGSVMTLHVTNGPPELRTAAVNAVRHWRYRPYEVDGRPTQVATTIYVNFSLRPPPTIVH
ncbi:MAG TPA: energy transducer TonB [Edaphobacter sp.]|nr:energy transducer TonB [Edaphobacter sp.]